MYVLDMDVTLDELQGASRTTGMFNMSYQQIVLKAFTSRWFCMWQCIWKYFTWGEEPMADQPALHQKGKVLVYISDKNPSTVVPTETPPSFKCSISMVHISKPLFEALAKKSPTINNPGRSYYLNQ